jgi:hypothetical protein
MGAARALDFSFFHLDPETLEVRLELSPEPIVTCQAKAIEHSVVKHSGWAVSKSRQKKHCAILSAFSLALKRCRRVWRLVQLFNLVRINAEQTALEMAAGTADFTERHLQGLGLGHGVAP